MPQKFELKEKFIERMKELLGEEFQIYEQAIQKNPRVTIRVNTLKKNPREVFLALTEKGWSVVQPFPKYPEIIEIEKSIGPGELGRAKEHVLGEYYVQDIASMLPVLALDPKPHEQILDVCASPGSKTTQIAARMQNSGTILANEMSFGRIKILASNLERCGVANALITKKEGVACCTRLEAQGITFDKILLDAPCSGEGTLITTPKTAKQWNEQTIFQLAGIQKELIRAAYKILKSGGSMIYSTCTHAPEENEAVVSKFLDETDARIEKIELPVSSRPGVTSWRNQKFSKELQKAHRIYPQDTQTEGFFLVKITKP